MTDDSDLISSLAGIVTVLNTPFTESDQIDERALCANVRRALRAGVAGFLVPAMASEVDRLSTAERIERAAQLVDLGCHAVLVALPSRDEVSYARELQQLAQQISAPLMIQD